MPRSINHFPDELVQNIIARNEDKETLYSLCFVSKRIHGITLPYLYKRLSHRMFQRPQRLHSFLRSIIARPALAAACVSVEICDPERCTDFWDLDSWRQWAQNSYVPVLEAADHLAVLTAGTSLYSNIQDQLEYLIRNEEAQVALLLCLTQNLTHLYIENPSTAIETPRFRTDHLLMTMIHPQIKAGVVLQNLRILVATSSRLEGGQGGFRLSAIAPFFRLPNLTTFKGTVCHEPEDGLFVGFDCPRRSSALTKLVFEHSAICPAALRLMIGACARLEHFACDWAGEVVGWVEVKFPLLRQALWEHRGSLKTLSLDTRKHFDSWPEHDDGFVPPLGPLKEFANLEVLDVPASALIGWDEDGFNGHDHLKDVLPPKIRELRINQIAPRVFEHLSDVALVCNERFPGLKRIVLCELQGYMDLSPLEGDLKKRFEDMGADVDFAIEYTGEPSHFLRN